MISLTGPAYYSCLENVVNSFIHSFVHSFSQSILIRKSFIPEMILYPNDERETEYLYNIQKGNKREAYLK